jgi:hypothetical protein
MSKTSKQFFSPTTLKEVTRTSNTVFYQYTLMFLKLYKKLRVTKATLLPPRIKSIFNKLIHSLILGSFEENN